MGGLRSSCVSMFVMGRHTSSGIAKEDLWITRRLASVRANVCVGAIEIRQPDVSSRLRSFERSTDLHIFFKFHLINHETSYTCPQYFTAVREAGCRLSSISRSVRPLAIGKSKLSHTDCDSIILISKFSFPSTFIAYSL